MLGYIFILLLALPCSAGAGMLDVDYFKPSPTKAFMWSAAVPGGGMFYLDHQLPKANRQYFSKGMLFLITQGAAAYFIVDRAGKGKDVMPLVGGLFLFKILEFSTVIDEAETMRHNRMALSLSR
jgi:hypothetical protein